MSSLVRRCMVFIMEKLTTTHTNTSIVLYVRCTDCLRYVIFGRWTQTIVQIRTLHYGAMEGLVAMWTTPLAVRAVRKTPKRLCHAVIDTRTMPHVYDSTRSKNLCFHSTCPYCTHPEDEPPFPVVGVDRTQRIRSSVAQSGILQ